MKILITVPHYYRFEEGSIYGSLDKDPSPRITALSHMINNLQYHFQQPHCTLHIATMSAEPANQTQDHKLDIVICTTQGQHLLDKIRVRPRSVAHYETKAEPRLLGFECQAVLRNQLGKYDYYCFMEDDLILHDPLFFEKLNWFTSATEVKNLLQPNRYEVNLTGPFTKGYIDGEINASAGAPYQNIQDQYQIIGRVFNQEFRFRRTTNPHSGCYFLSAAQMEYWASQPYFLDRDTGFVDPMASAATLGITKTFRVYKPTVENASFLEIEHADQRYLWQVGSQVQINHASFNS